MANVLVIAELLNGQLRKNSLSAITFAKQVTQATSGKFAILSIGQGASKASEQLAVYGAEKVFVTQIDGGYLAEKYAATVEKVSKENNYTIVAATATTFGKDLLPRVAAKLQAGVASDISAVTVEADKLRYQRPMYAGNVLGTMQITTEFQVVTVRQSDFDLALAEDTQSPVQQVDQVQDGCASKIEFVDLKTVKRERPDLTDADIVVSGGRALKSAENFQNILEPLVDTLGAAMGASRAACDAGYVPGDLQVGQTGKIVAPKLYIAVGISGAIQHLAGMKGSKTIVAINKDNEAPIAQVSDYFWTADLFEAVPALTEALKQS